MRGFDISSVKRPKGKVQTNGMPRERYTGIAVDAARCTLAVVSEKGRKLKDFPVETNGQALVEAVRMIPGHKHLVFEEGLESAWLYETLSPNVDELVVAGITPHRVRTKREFWTDCGPGIVTRSSSDWVQTAEAAWVKARAPQTRGPSRQHN